MSDAWNAPCKRLAFLAVSAASLAAATLVAAASAAQAGPRDKWCKGVHLRFFVGGSEGDAFGTIVYNGARQAEHDLGPTVDYIFSGWDPEKMVQQLREAVAVRPDGIAMMGHAGDAAIMPLAEEAAKAGVRMMYQNVPAPQVVAKFGGGYVGAQPAEQGRALALEMVRRFGLKTGEVAIVIGGFDENARAARELAVANALEEAGVKVVRINNKTEWAADPNLALPVITATVEANPTAKAIVYPGGQELGDAAAYMQAAGKAPGEIINVGFDTNPQVVEGFKGGWVQLTADQQPFLQGYMPILGLCQEVVYGLAPINVDTGAGFVTPDNYQSVARLAVDGLR
jgi:simple sugar transport system substrate-binding protein